MRRRRDAGSRAQWIGCLGKRGREVQQGTTAIRPSGSLRNLGLRLCPVTCALSMRASTPRKMGLPSSSPSEAQALFDYTERL